MTATAVYSRTFKPSLSPVSDKNSHNKKKPIRRSGGLVFKRGGGGMGYSKGNKRGDSYRVLNYETVPNGTINGTWTRPLFLRQIPHGLSRVRAKKMAAAAANVAHRGMELVRLSIFHSLEPFGQRLVSFFFGSYVRTFVQPRPKCTSGLQGRAATTIVLGE